MPYSQLTSENSIKYIIDMFNQTCLNKSYLLNTITVIYNNEELFDKENRYPIDAPYRSFYDTLANDYVPKHDLDKMFTLNSVKRDELYFEYVYSSVDNSFNIVSYPNNWDEKTVIYYIPMLFSMTTGIEIDWEAAASNSYFSGTHSEEIHKVLVVFGEDKLDTLEFNWLATFTLNNSHHSIEEIKREIRNNEAEKLIFLTQGVLFTELDKQIFQFMKIRDSYKEITNLIKDHKHTIKNFGLVGGFHSLYELVKDDEQLLKVYTYIENLLMLHDYATDVLYNYDNNSDVLLLKKNGVTTYTKMLDVIHSATKRYFIQRIYYSESEIANNTVNWIDNEDLKDVFTVLLNLYSNCMNHGKDDYKISLETLDDALLITFINKGEIPESFQEYLLSSNNSLIEKEGESGIKFITESLAYLKHITVSCIVQSNTTQILLTIKKKNGTIQ